MKRWLVRICVFLILGAIVNVAVVMAWDLRGASLYWQVSAPTQPLAPDEVIAFRRPPWLVANLGTLVAVAIAASCCAIEFRRWRRIRRGLCPKCAYDLRGRSQGSACPECGSIVAS